MLRLFVSLTLVLALWPLGAHARGVYGFPPRQVADGMATCMDAATGGQAHGGPSWVEDLPDGYRIAVPVYSARDTSPGSKVAYYDLWLLGTYEDAAQWRPEPPLAYVALGRGTYVLYHVEDAPGAFNPSGDAKTCFYNATWLTNPQPYRS